MTQREALAAALALNQEMWRELSLMQVRMDVLDRWLKHTVGPAAHAAFEAEVVQEVKRKRVVGNVVELRGGAADMANGRR